MRSRSVGAQAITSQEACTTPRETIKSGVDIVIQLGGFVGQPPPAPAQSSTRTREYRSSAGGSEGPHVCEVEPLVMGTLYIHHATLLSHPHWICRDFSPVTLHGTCHVAGRVPLSRESISSVHWDGSAKSGSRYILTTNEQGRQALDLRVTRVRIGLRKLEPVDTHHLVQEAISRQQLTPDDVPAASAA